MKPILSYIDSPVKHSMHSRASRGEFLRSSDSSYPASPLNKFTFKPSESDIKPTNIEIKSLAKKVVAKKFKKPSMTLNLALLDKNNEKLELIRKLKESEREKQNEIKNSKIKEKNSDEHHIESIIRDCINYKNFKDTKYQEDLAKIAIDRKKIHDAITTYEEILNANNYDTFVGLNEIKEENNNAQKRNIDNFLSPDVINRFKNENFLNSLYLTHMKNKSVWKPDKFKLPDKIINNIKMNKT